MKVRVSVGKSFEVDVVSDAIEKLRNYWLERDISEGAPGELIDNAIADIEKITGLPFDDEYAIETIVRLDDVNGNLILE